MNIILSYIIYCFSFSFHYDNSIWDFMIKLLKKLLKIIKNY